MKPEIIIYSQKAWCRIHESPVHAVLNYVSSNEVCLCWLIALLSWVLHSLLFLYYFCLLFWGVHWTLRDLLETSHLGLSLQGFSLSVICGSETLLQEEVSLMMSEQGTDLWGEQNIIRHHLSLHFFLFFKINYFYPGTWAI